MFEPTVQPQVYIATTLEKKDGDKTEFPLCYNVNMIQKVPVSTYTDIHVGKYCNNARNSNVTLVRPFMSLNGTEYQRGSYVFAV